MDNIELSNMILSAIRNPDNSDNLSLHDLQMKTEDGITDVKVLAWLNSDFTHSPMIIFCTPEVTKNLILSSPDPQK